MTKGEQIRARLAAGQKYARIAAEVGTTPRTVSAYASVFRRRGNSAGAGAATGTSAAGRASRAVRV